MGLAPNVSPVDTESHYFNVSTYFIGVGNWHSDGENHLQI